jgi:DNA-binding transcriptional LysR family regulator
MLTFLAMQSLRLFCDVARCRSFSQAAAEHGITQSAASQRVGALERKLGVTLLDRSSRPLSLTPAGQVFFTEGRELLARYDDLERRVSALHQPAPAGLVRVDAIYSAGIDLLRHVQEIFSRQHPQVNVVVEYKRPDEVYQAVRDHECDLGIVSYPQRWRDVGTMLLRQETMAVVCGPHHPLAKRHKIQAASLGAWAMVSFEQELPVGRRIRRYLRQHGADPRVVSVFDNIDTIKHALTVTETFAILPRRTVMADVNAGTLCVVQLEPKLTRPLGILFARGPRDSRSLAPAVQAFVDCLMEHAGPHVDLSAAPQAERLAGARA